MSKSKSKDEYNYGENRNMKMTMDRREFIRNSGLLVGGVATIALGVRCAPEQNKPAKPSCISRIFPQYTMFNPQFSVYCVTPGLNGCFHRFFNTSPISPSGRYLAATHMFHENRLSVPDEEAEIILVDLLTGVTSVVAKTRGFDTQLGAQAQWGATDNELFFNDLDTKDWHAFGVKMNPITGRCQNLCGPIFEVTRDGKYAASVCLLRSAITQRGYGVVVPPEVLPWNEGASHKDGVYLTDTTTGKCKLIASYKDIVEACGGSIHPLEPERGGAYHGHQVSWNPQGTRLLLALAFNYPKPIEIGKRPLDMCLITMKPDGSDIHVALKFNLWRLGGHHPCWCPDGEYITQNLRIDNENMRFIRMRYDGSELISLNNKISGCGHPSLHCDGRHLLSDAYVFEPLAFKDGTVPIRLVDIEAGTEQIIARIGSKPPYMGPFYALRVDPHPAWDRTFSRIAFNACPDGTRRIYIADINI